MSSPRFLILLEGQLALCVPLNADHIEAHILTYVEGFPPAGAIFSAIGVLLAVRILSVAIRGLLLSPTFYRQQRA